MIADWILLLILVVVIVAVMIKVLHPPQVVSMKKVVFVHAFLISGLVLLNMWIFLSNVENPMLLSGSIWSIGGGLCVGVVYIIRSQKNFHQTE